MWCISILYKHFTLKRPLPRGLQKAYNIENISIAFEDDCMFIQNKADFDYFWDLYNAILGNQVDLDIELRKITDIRLVNVSMKSFLICLLAEQIYLNIDIGIIITEYLNLLEIYNEPDDNKIISKIAEKYSRTS